MSLSGGGVVTLIPNFDDSIGNLTYRIKNFFKPKNTTVILPYQTIPEKVKQIFHEIHGINSKVGTIIMIEYAMFILSICYVYIKYKEVTMKLSDRIRVSGKAIGESLKTIGAEIQALSATFSELLDKGYKFFRKDERVVETTCTDPEETV